MYQLPDRNSTKKNFAFTSLILDYAEKECCSILCNLQIWGWNSLRLCWKLKFYLQIDIFKVKDALRIFFSLFFPFSAHQWRWIAISNFRICKKWNVTLTVNFQGQGYLSDFFSIFFLFSTSNYVGKHSKTLTSTRNEIWPWNTDFQG